MNLAALHSVTAEVMLILVAQVTIALRRRYGYRYLEINDGEATKKL